MDFNGERKKKRLLSGLPDSIDESRYNLVLGLTIFYGFFVNTIMIVTCFDLFAKIPPVVFYISYFVCFIAGALVARSSSPVISFLGYNLIVLPIGALLTVSLPFYSKKDILSAVMVTGIVVLIMILISTARPQLFAGMGRALMISLIVGIIAEVAAWLLGYGGTLFSWLFVIIFTLYIGYDWSRAQAYPKTVDNAIDSAIDIYLDIINLFIRILRLLGRSRD